MRSDAEAEKVMNPRLPLRPGHPRGRSVERSEVSNHQQITPRDVPRQWGRCLRGGCSSNRVRPSFTGVDSGVEETRPPHFAGARGASPACRIFPENAESPVSPDFAAIPAASLPRENAAFVQHRRSLDPPRVSRWSIEYALHDPGNAGRAAFSSLTSRCAGRWLRAPVLHSPSRSTPHRDARSAACPE